MGPQLYCVAIVKGWSVRMTSIWYAGSPSRHRALGSLQNETLSGQRHRQDNKSRPKGSIESPLCLNSQAI